MKKLMTTKELSFLFDNLSTMLNAGIQIEDALMMLSKDEDNRALSNLLKEMASQVVLGNSVVETMRNSGEIPEFAVKMISNGESAGRLEQVLSTLARYYERQDYLVNQIKGALLYPIILLLLMCGVLILMVSLVLPVFTRVYENMIGSLAGTSLGYIYASNVISWIALVLTGVICLIVLSGAIMAKSEKGRNALGKCLQKFVFTKKAAELLSLYQFTDALSTMCMSGCNTDIAMESAMDVVTHSEVKKSLEDANREMQEGLSLAQALINQHVYPSVYTSVLIAGAHSGELERELELLAKKTSEDAEAGIQRLISVVEPVLTGFLTIAVGISLLSVMLPLVGMMGAIA